MLSIISLCNDVNTVRHAGINNHYFYSEEDADETTGKGNQAVVVTFDGGSSDCRLGSTGISDCARG